MYTKTILAYQHGKNVKCISDPFFGFEMKYCMVTLSVARFPPEIGRMKFIGSRLNSLVRLDRQN